MLSNYGIKKMLPRLIIAVLLVNFSYIICGIAVDLGNLLGYGIGSLLQGTTPATFEAGNLGLQTKSGLAITNASIATIAIAGAAAVILAISIPVILSALMAVAMTVIILMARQAIIIILVVVSPIAFVAYLLPNTEKWFKKWLDLFVAMIILFPALALVFAASRIAAQVIANTAADDNWLLQLSAIGAAMLPFFASLPIINGSLKAAGAIGSTLGGMANSSQRQVAGGAKNKLKDRYGKTSYARGRALRKDAREKNSAENFANKMNGTGWRGRGARIAARGTSALNPFKSGKKQRDYINRAAYGAADKADSEEVNFAAQQAMSAANDKLAKDGGDVQTVLRKGLDEALASGDSVKARAHMKALESTGEEGIEHVRAALHKAGTAEGGMDAGVKGDVIKHLSANSSLYKSKDVRVDRFKNSGNFDDLVSANLSGLTDEQIASQTKHSLRSSNLDQATAERIINNENTSKEVKLGKRAGFDGVISGDKPADAF